MSPAPVCPPPLRALIVDDLPEISFPIARYLDQHCAGGVLVAKSAAEAIAHLEKVPIHIVVSDLRMPDRDGISLLAEVHKRWPATLRVLLTGQSQWESALAEPHCHQFLSKPVELHHLGALLVRVSTWLDPTFDQEIANGIGGAAVLASAQATLTAMHDLLAGPHPRGADLATIIRRDPGLSARVLQIANASFFGGGSRITDVDGATSLLGASYLQDLHRRGALMAAFVGGEGAGGGLDVEGLARHALVVAQTAKATLRDPRAAEAAYSAGLLHGVGWFVLTAAKGQEAADAAQADPGLVERVGAQLLAFWGLPSQIVSGVAHSFLPPEEQNFGPASAVHLARALADVAAGGSPALGPRVRLSDEFVIRHNLQDRLPALLDKASKADQHARRTLSPVPAARAM